jgi:hypothetical protein
VAEGVAVARWLLRDNLGCELGIILSGEKLGIGRVLTELGVWSFLFFWNFGFWGFWDAPDDRPGTGVAVAGSGW